MTRPDSSPSANGIHKTRRSLTMAAILLGVPLGLAILGSIYFGPFQHTVARRYVTHPVECVEVVMFCMALGALASKLKRHGTERRACRTRILPAWDGKAVPVSEAGALIRELQGLPARLQDTWIVKRAATVLEFVQSRGSANELDDHLRALADNDALALETSYSLTRFITWAIPILGFLGTVLGITGAISGVTPEVLEQSLGTVTDGLALAFDATALALGLTMLTMFLSFMVERGEQSVLEQVDRFADRELAHRFERTGAESDKRAEAIRRNTRILTEAVEQVTQRQTALWEQAVARADDSRRRAEEQAENRFTAALQSALESSLNIYAANIAKVEKQVIERCSGLVEQLTALTNAIREAADGQAAGLAQIGQKFAELVDAATRLGDDSKGLRLLQESLNQNLATLAESGRFVEAMHSLTAAIHLLTARTAPASAAVRPVNRPGTAA